MGDRRPEGGTARRCLHPCGHRKGRRQAALLQVRELPFYRFEGGAVSTFDQQSYRNWANAGQKVAGIDLVDVAPLARILEPFLEPGQKVDYMNIDVEGHDVDALVSYDFDRFAPRVVSIEADSLDLHDPSSNPAFQLLTGRGYRLVSQAIITSIYML